MIGTNLATDRPLYVIVDYTEGPDGKIIATLKHRFNKSRKNIGPYYLIRF